MDFLVTSLGSGSSGNSFLVQYGSNSILIDAGFSRKETLKRLKDISVATESIQAILITHEHSDHVKGLRVLADTLDIPGYVTYQAAKYLDSKNYLSKKRVIFDPGTPFKVSAFNIHPFRIAHDAIDPVGFVVSVDEKRLGLALDLGHMNSLVFNRIKECSTFILETNYEPELLMNSERSIRLKRRIAGKFGHLSNDDAINSFDKLITDETNNILLGHLSSECNDSEIVNSKALSKLNTLGKNHLNFDILKQHSISKTYSV